MTDSQHFKLGVRQGGGPEPGYEWTVVILDFVFEETIKLLGETGYGHLAQQVRMLAMQPNPARSDVVDVKPIDAFYEIRDKGFPYGGANVRLFYGIDDRPQHREIIPLGTIKKQNDGQTLHAVVVRMRTRWQRYLRGDYGPLPG